MYRTTKRLDGRAMHRKTDGDYKIWIIEGANAYTVHIAHVDREFDFVFRRFVPGSFVEAETVAEQALGEIRNA